MFIDEVVVFVKAGSGGDGMSSMRREKFVPMGGPDGGDGGRGGSVYFVADEGMNTLLAFRYQRHLRAEPGGKGGTRQKHGRAGEDLRIKVPVGTIVYEISTEDASVSPGRDATGPQVADLSEAGQETMVARGGRGGLGNTHFKTSTNQAPRVAQKGEPGQEKWLRLELKTLADVGLVGYPNVGKSTLLAAISRANPKIASYPFTTLSPNLGVVDLGDEPFVVADIPGLVEGAHRGVGLGHDFLRHIERTRVLVHMVDGTREDPLADFDDINEELELFDPGLRAKTQLIAINKMDLTEVAARAEEIRAGFAARGLEVFAISAVSGTGVRPLLFAAQAALRDARAVEAERPVSDEATVVLRPRAVDLRFEVERGEDGFRVKGSRVERAAAMTNLEHDEAVAMLEKVLQRMGVTAALEKAGVKPGDTVRFGKVEMLWGSLSEDVRAAQQPARVPSATRGIGRPHGGRRSGH